MKKKLKILMVEDSKDDALLIIRNISKESFEPEYERVETPETMEAALNSKKWDIILSDYNMPNFSGLDALKIFKKMDFKIPFIIISGTIGEELAIDTIRLGASDYIMKDNLARLVPSIKRGLQETRIKKERENAIKALTKSEDRLKSFMNSATELFSIWNSEINLVELNKAAIELFSPGAVKKDLIGKKMTDLIPSVKESGNLDKYLEVIKTGKPYYHEQITPPQLGSRNLAVKAFKVGKGLGMLTTDITARKLAEDKLRKSYTKLQKTLNGTINALASIVETNDPYTSGHQKRVAFLAIAISEELGLDENIIESVGTAAIIHDIGKINVPASILSKPGKLSDIEFSMIKTHSRTGYDIAKNIEFVLPIDKILLQHHERLDGSGYPDGIKGKDILLEAKILTVADVVEAMSTHRPYRPSLGIDKALEEISKGKGKIYDSKVVDACEVLFMKKDFNWDKM